MSKYRRQNFAIFEIDKRRKTSKRLVPSTYKELGIQEVQHLEPWIISNTELLGEDLLVITNQLTGFDKTKERTDVLALDTQGRLVVIEIKRDRSGDKQDLQALRYASYCSVLGIDEILKLYIAYSARSGLVLTEDEALQNLHRHACDGSLDAIDNSRLRIVLVAASFQAELISTCLWMIKTYEMDIKCIQLVPYEIGGKIYFANSVLIPLPEAEDFLMKWDMKERQVKSKRSIDWNAVRAIVAQIPKGHWMSYGDVAVAAGATKDHAKPLGQFLAHDEYVSTDGVRRVLREDGSISKNWSGEIGKQKDCFAVLKKEGLAFSKNGKADSNRRFKMT